MTIITNQAMKTLRRAVFPILAAASLAAGYAQNYLPINTETRKELEKAKTQQIQALEIKYNESIQSARSEFNKSIVDGNFSLAEQYNVYSGFTNIFSLEQQLKNYGVNKFNPQSKQYLEADSTNALRFADINLFNNLSNSITGDSRELQISLNNENLAIRVEQTSTNKTLESKTQFQNMKTPCCAAHYPNLATNHTSFYHEKWGPSEEELKRLEADNKSMVNYSNSVASTNIESSTNTSSTNLVTQNTSTQNSNALKYLFLTVSGASIGGLIGFLIGRDSY